VGLRTIVVADLAKPSSRGVLAKPVTVTSNAAGILMADTPAMPDNLLPLFEASAEWNGTSMYWTQIAFLANILAGSPISAISLSTRAAALGHV
jgi:hypothetical protein